MANTDSEFAGDYAPAGQQAPAQSRTKMMLSAGIGHFIEWFDFGLYGTLAAIIATNFFASGDPPLRAERLFPLRGAAQGAGDRHRHHLLLHLRDGHFADLASGRDTRPGAVGDYPSGAGLCRWR